MSGMEAEARDEKDGENEGAGDGAKGRAGSGSDSGDRMLLAALLGVVGAGVR